MQISNITLSNNTEIPSIGLGTWQLTGPECLHAIKTALKIGYRHIDTAEMYMNESEIGQVIRESTIPRDQLFITSKAWQNNLNFERVIKACEISLKRLKTDYLDLYLIHWPDKYLNMKEILRGFKQLYDQKKIKAFGVSNFTINHLKDVIPICKELDLPISVNQVEFHPLLYQKELLDFCKENNITITAYSPLATGKIVKDETIKELAIKHDKTPSQISLRWLLSKGIVVIPKASSDIHLQQNIDIDFTLDQEDIERIDNIKHQERMINPGFSEFDY